MRELTERQRAVLRTIVQSIISRGYPPTLREIGVKMGIRSTNGVNDHLKALEKKGYLTRDDQKSRALVPTERGWRAILGTTPASQFPRSDRPSLPGPIVEVPVYPGSIAAGSPRLADEVPDDTLHIDGSLLGTRSPVFGVKVEGDSMIEDGILAGDYVFVKKQPTASAGSIVLVWLSDYDGVTLKRYYPEKDRIRLQPGNSALDPYYVAKDDNETSRIIGVVVGVYRSLR